MTYGASVLPWHHAMLPLMSSAHLLSVRVRSGVPRATSGAPGQAHWTFAQARTPSVGSESDGPLPRLRARSTPVPSIKEGILDNDAIGNDQHQW